MSRTLRIACILVFAFVITCIAGTYFRRASNPFEGCGLVLRTSHGRILVTRQNRSADARFAQTLTFWGKPENRLQYQSGLGNSRILLELDSDPQTPYADPVVFRHGGEEFLYVSTVATGSAGFVEETIYWIAPDLTLQQVPFTPAALKLQERLAPGLVAVAVGPGIILSRGALEFEIRIAHPQDPHCCPSGESIRGTYTIVGDRGPANKSGYSHNFRVAVNRITPLI